MRYKKPKPKYLILRDIATAYSYGKVKSGKRIQVKIPKVFLEEIDKTWPNENRSKIITQSVIESLLRKSRISNRNLEMWQNEEQYDLDRVWDYLEERENEK